MDAFQTLSAILLILLALIIYFWRSDKHSWDVKEQRLLDRIQAGSLDRLDAHEERVEAREARVNGTEEPIIPKYDEQDNEDYSIPPDFAAGERSFSRLMDE